MIQQLIAHLDRLQIDLASIDPVTDIDAADRVAAIALALRRAVETDAAKRPSTGLLHAAAPQHDAA